MGSEGAASGVKEPVGCCRLDISRRLLCRSVGWVGSDGMQKDDEHTLTYSPGHLLCAFMIRRVGQAELPQETRRRRSMVESW